MSIGLSLLALFVSVKACSIADTQTEVFRASVAPNPVIEELQVTHPFLGTHGNITVYTPLIRNVGGPARTPFETLTTCSFLVRKSSKYDGNHSNGGVEIEPNQAPVKGASCQYSLADYGYASANSNYLEQRVIYGTIKYFDMVGRSFTTQWCREYVNNNMPPAGEDAEIIQCRAEIGLPNERVQN